MARSAADETTGTRPSGARPPHAVLASGRAAAPVLLAVAAALPLAPAAAAAGHGVSVKVLSRTASHGRELIVEEVTFQPGASTGWHWHDGVLYGRMAQGELTHTLADCSTTQVYAPGDAAVEPSGADNVHIGRNLGAKPAVQIVLVDKPAGTPDARAVPNPGCDFE